MSDTSIIAQFSMPLTTAIIGLSKRVNDYQLSTIDRLSVY